METITAQLDRAFRAAITAALGVDADPLVAPSQNAQFGDYQSNAAMGLAKLARSNPRAVATQIQSKLDLGEIASPDDVTIAGPGFINVRLSPQWVARQLEACAADGRLGLPLVSSSETTVVDYSGLNIAKQPHIGHFRPTNIGDALARVIEFSGPTVVRQNHLGDWGTQFGMLLAYLKATGTATDTDARIDDLDAFYKQARERFDADPAFADQARKTVVRLQAGQPEELRLWAQIVAASRLHFQPLYERLNITLRPEHERGESFYNPLLPNVVQELRDKGVAVESDGAVVVFVAGYEAPLIVQKRDGGYGYGTTDLAAIRFRVRELRARRIIYVTDARQQQHFAQVFDAARRAGWTDGINVEHVTFGTILGTDGKPLKTRDGTPTPLAGVVDEAEERALAVVTAKSADLPEAQRREIAHAVGVGAIKYYDLNKDRTGDYVFDWDKMLAMDGNTAPYLQYAYARIRSIFRKAGATPKQVQSATLQLTEPHELALAKHILRLGEAVETVARELKPHHLCNYLYDLATKFSGFYENCPVLQADEPTRASRLLLCDLTARTLAQGLDLLGIEHPEQM